MEFDNEFDNEFNEFDIVNFLSENSESESDNENESLPRKKIVNHVLENVNQSVNLQIRNKFSSKATSDVIKLMNKMPNAAIKLPERE